MATPHEYYQAVIGKAFDEDGVYGAQCVDGFKHFCRTVLGKDLTNVSICYNTGYAHSIWDNIEELGLNEYFDKVPSNQMTDGDWSIWATGSPQCPSSHIAMFRKDNGNGTGIFLGQNQAGISAYSQINISYAGIRGGLRPKIYHQAPPQPAPTPQPSKSISEIADEVIRGDWGNGEERRQRLEQAGYNYNDVQTEVNRKLAEQQPQAPSFNVGDVVVPIQLIDYYGTHLTQYDDTYTISQINGDRAVLMARGQVWAAMNTNNIKKI